MGMNIPIVTSLQKKKLKNNQGSLEWDPKTAFCRKVRGSPPHSQFYLSQMMLALLIEAKYFFLSFHNNRIIQYMYTYNRNGNPLKIKGDGKLILSDHLNDTSPKWNEVFPHLTLVHLTSCIDKLKST